VKQMDQYPTARVDDRGIQATAFIPDGLYGLVPLLDGWGLGRRDCWACGGTGELEPPKSPNTLTARCPACFGAGGVPVLRRPCEVCYGTNIVLTARDDGRPPDRRPCWGCEGGYMEVDNNDRTEATRSE